VFPKGLKRKPLARAAFTVPAEKNAYDPSRRYGGAITQSGPGHLPDGHCHERAAAFM
jgi:hypothetical protein